MYRHNQDYGFFQVVYYDFPAYDSPARIFGSAINLFVTFYLTYDTAADTTLSLESVVSITLQTSNIRNANDFAKQITQELAGVATQLVTGAVYDSTLVSALSILQSFEFDSGSQKFVATFAPAELESLNVTTGIFPNPYYNGIRMTISSGVLDKTKGAYLAAMMGGVYNSATGTFKSVYDYEDDFFAYSDHKALYFLMQKKFGTDTTSKYILPGITSVSAYSENCPRMTLDDYIYIRGAPESSIWNTDGTSSDIAAILPRNRLLNQSVSTEAAFLTASTHIIKSSLNSMRVMKLYITDKDGNQLQFDDDYVLQIAILFTVD